MTNCFALRSQPSFARVHAGILSDIFIMYIIAGGIFYGSNSEFYY